MRLEGSRLRPATRGRSVLFPAVCVLTAATVCSWILFEVLTRGPLTRLDMAIATGAYGMRTDPLTVLALVFTFIGSAEFLTPASLLVLAVLLWFRYWRTGIVFASVMAVTLIATVVLKDLIGTVRPASEQMIGPVLTSFSFPSGHTLNTTVFTGLVVGIALTWIHRRRLRTTVVAAAIGLMLCVGASRIYLGFHWLTDVLGGWSLGMFALATTALVLGILRLRDRTRAAAAAVSLQTAAG